MREPIIRAIPLASAPTPMAGGEAQRVCPSLHSRWPSTTGCSAAAARVASTSQRPISWASIVLSSETRSSPAHIMVGAIDASNAPRMNRKMTSPVNDVKAAMIIHEVLQPMKQKMIQ